MDPGDFIFVNSNGCIWRPEKIALILAKILKIVKPPNPEAFAPYSFRLGVMSLAHLQGIDLLELVKYVT